MTSINTNVAAMTALQTLQQTNSMMDETQNRISTGFRVSEAKDNAAYWSIASTMRSDSSSLSAVQDALGLGAATVDTAYTGLTASKDVLGEIKNKLTAASADGVDLDKVQSEIKQLQGQLKSIAESASFSGANWLSVNSGSSKFSSETSVVSSYSKAGGAVSLGSVKIDLNEVKLFDAAATGTSGGIMDKQMTLTGADGKALTVGGKDSVAAQGSGPLQAGSAVAGRATAAATADFAALTFDNLEDTITFSVAVDGGTAKDVTIARGTVQTALNNSADSVVISNADEMALVVTQALKDAGVEGVTVGTKAGGAANASVLTFTSAKTGPTSNVAVTAGAANDGGGTVDMTAFAAGMIDSAAATFEKASVTLGAFNDKMTFVDDDSMSFSLAVDGGAAATVKITKQTISDALGTTDGKINSAAEFQAVVIKALAEPDGAGGGTAITNVTVGSMAKDGSLTFTSTGTGSTSAVAISGIVTDFAENASVGQDALISVAEIDISKAGLKGRGVETAADTKAVLTAYVNIVDAAIENVTSAAATLGSVSSRIDMQQNFLSKLNDTIEKGVGTLVDADMTEESTRLKALQTQQQLGVQALSIANNSSQSLLSLFR
ncbi:flagellin [Fulvimarina sp. 2208YS6-2-32]|uniref:Flagellin n=1 Tax=Fulvimarina uroteuthidis TaxID=3098149 RepID=A0ABU5I2S0_9HYPH|nr:flagellin [Fulvimarina sp. 2208YS6-2-32]MDY8109058.1 flagellin [Fulvimarina sp. 2208YS6-2-32]